MTAETWTIILAVAGVVAELAGIVLVGLEIRKDLRAARDLLGGDAGRFPVGISVKTPYAIEGREPTTEERLARLADQVDRLETAQDELRSEMQGEVAKRVGAVVRWLDEQLSSGIGPRVAGVALFVVGALLSAAANVVDALT